AGALAADRGVVGRAGAPLAREREAPRHVGGPAPPQRRGLDIERRRLLGVAPARAFGGVEVRERGPILLAAIEAFQLREERRFSRRLGVALLQRAARAVGVAEIGPGR